MYRYLLDSNVVVVFQKTERLDALVAAASTVSMAMVNDVYEELTVPKPGKPMKPEMSEARRMLGACALEIEQILAASREDDIRAELLARKGKMRPGPGEAASVAFAVVRDDHIVVTADLAAVASAARLYAELRGEVGRILGLHAFLRLLTEREAITPAVATLVSDAAKTKSNFDPPLWWAAWSREAPSTPPDLPR